MVDDCCSPLMHSPQYDRSPIRSHEPPWNQMQSALDSYHVPSGYRVTQRTQQGGGGEPSPLCQGRPSVAVEEHQAVMKLGPAAALYGSAVGPPPAAPTRR